MAKKTAKTDANLLEQMFPTFKSEADEAAPPQATPPAGDQSATIAALQAQLAELDKKLKTQEETNLALMQRPDAVANPVPVPPEIDFSKAPDPLDDKAGYAKFVADVGLAQQRYAAEVAAYSTTKAQQGQARIDQLWKQFNEAYPDYAGNAKRVEIAARSVVERAQQLGLDPEKYMYGTSGKFMKDVVAEMDDIFGKPSAVEQVDEDEEDDDRSVMLGAGAPQGGRHSAQPAEKLGTMMDDIKSWQKATGFTS